MIEVQGQSMHDRENRLPDVSPWSRLDSHDFLWFIWDGPNLSRTARSLIEDPTNLKLVSVATCWEIATKVALKKLFLRESATTFLPRELKANGLGVLAIELAHATFVESPESVRKRHAMSQVEEDGGRERPAPSGVRDARMNSVPMRKPAWPLDWTPIFAAT
jgi:PIN domain nuclease of toxin-antitoxin system